MWLDLLKNILDDDFGRELKECIGKLGRNIKDFSEECGIPKSTMYKIVSDKKKDFRVSTLRQIVKTIKTLEGYDKGYIVGIITTRGALDTIAREFNLSGRVIKVSEYPATTIEEEIIQGIRAEKEGAKGLICGPVAANTLEKVVDIPIVSIRFEEGPLNNAIRKLVHKI